MHVLSSQRAEIGRLFQGVRERRDRGKGGNEYDLDLIYLSNFGQKPLQIGLYLFVREVHLPVASYNLFFHDRLALYVHVPNANLTEGRAELGAGLLRMWNKNSKSAPVKRQLKLSVRDGLPPPSPIIEALQNQPRG